MNSFQLPSLNMARIGSCSNMNQAVQGMLLTEDEGETYLSVFECTTDRWNNHFNRPSILKGAQYVETVTLDSNNVAYIFKVESNDVTLYLSDLTSEGMDMCKTVYIDTFSGLGTIYVIDPVKETIAFQSAMEHVLEFNHEVLEL